MAIVHVTFTGVNVSVNQVSHNLSNYLPPGTAEQFTPEQHDNAVFGSKFVMILEEFILGLKQNKLVKLVAAYCVFGYIVTQILYLGVWCRPIQQYWQVPVDNCESEDTGI
ncbi:MAG: hypothetical protein Q9181_005193 [Wetmoreana brouardii]